MTSGLREGFQTPAVTTIPAGTAVPLRPWDFAQTGVIFSTAPSAPVSGRADVLGIPSTRHLVEHRKCNAANRLLVSTVGIVRRCPNPPRRLLRPQKP